MFVIFHNDEIWDQYEDRKDAWNAPIPLYALGYNDSSKLWWMWYYSWNNITQDIQTGGRELPPIAKAYLLLTQG